MTKPAIAVVPLRYVRGGIRIKPEKVSMHAVLQAWVVEPDGLASAWQPWNNRLKVYRVSGDVCRGLPSRERPTLKVLIVGVPL